MKLKMTRKPEVLLTQSIRVCRQKLLIATCSWKSDRRNEWI